MSYILDALRRAEAERERGAVPGLQSQQHSLEGEDDAPERSRLLVWAVIGLAFALIATLAWTLLGGSSSAPRQIAETTATATATAPATAPATVTPAAPVAQSLSEIAAQPSASLVPPPTPSTAPATLPTTTTPPPVRVVQTPKATPLAMPAATPPARPAAPTPTPTPTPKAAPAVALDAPKPAATAASEPHVYAQAELPEEIRRELPRVAVNGSSYSGDAASRMVMINGQVFHEGDQLAAGLVLDKIKRRSAVLAYKGWRYEITF